MIEGFLSRSIDRANSRHLICIEWSRNNSDANRLRIVRFGEHSLWELAATKNVEIEFSLQRHPNVWRERVGIEFLFDFGAFRGIHLSPHVFWFPKKRTSFTDLWTVIFKWAFTKRIVLQSLLTTRVRWWQWSCENIHTFADIFRRKRHEEKDQTDCTKSWRLRQRQKCPKKSCAQISTETCV